MEADRSMRQRERNVFMNKKILMTYVVMLVAAVIFCILPATIPFMRNTSTLSRWRNWRGRLRPTRCESRARFW